MVITVDAVVRLLLGLMWPLVVLVLAFTFRRELGAFLEGIIGFMRGGLSKVSLPGGFAFELVKTTEYKVDWTGPGGQDLRNMVAMGQPASGVPDILALLKPQQPSRSADYAVFDLGSGDKWLTSRLHLFSMLLRRTHGLRYCVFIYDTPAVSGRSVGFATTEAVRWSLARRYPYLEQSAPMALAANEQITSNTGALDPQSASSFINAYLQRIQIKLLFSKWELTKDWKGLTQNLLTGVGLFGFLRLQLPEPALKELRAGVGSYDKGAVVVVDALNTAIENHGLYEESRFSGVTLLETTKKLVTLKPEGYNRTMLNRLLLQEAYPQFFAPVALPDGFELFDDNEWVRLRTRDTESNETFIWEKARWLDRASVEKLLGSDDLSRAQVRMSSLQAVSRKDQVSMLLRVEGAMVAIVGAGGHFERLIDRQALAARAIEFSL